MNAAGTRALETRQLIEADFASFSAMPDLPGQKVHSLFAGLYRETIIQWLRAIEGIGAPLFTNLVVRRFYEIYELSVPECLGQPARAIPRPWQTYHWLSNRLTIRSPIFLHLLLLSMGARAHTRHDLAEAISHAARQYSQLTGREVDFERERPNIIGPISARAFFSAALDYVEMHRSQRRGWRYVVLSIYGVILRVLRPLWLGVFEGWRRRAWVDARKDFLSRSES